MSSLQAVLWDMDGTLVDTEPYWIAAEYRLVGAFGGEWNDEHAHALVGNPLLVSAAYIRKHGGVELPLDDIVERLLAEVIADTRQYTAWRPGVLGLLSELHDVGVPCAMVTMSYRSLAEAVNEQLPPGTFQSLVTGDEVTRGKPDPEAYLVAARRLNADPTRCIAIEDSPAGIRSAEAAGCVTIAVPNQVPIKPVTSRIIVDSLAGVTIADLAQLTGLAPPQVEVH
ncbi:HAD family hydrolase [Jatrophihabitans sp. DSM 45814]